MTPRGWWRRVRAKAIDGPSSHIVRGNRVDTMKDNVMRKHLCDNRAGSRHVGHAGMGAASS